MSTDAIKAYVGLEGAELDVGETAGPTVCPRCDGGRAGEAKFYVTRIEPGVLAWICHRASCGERGIIGQHSRAGARVVAKKAKTKEYTGEILPLTLADLQFFYETYHVSAADKYIKLTGLGEFLLPIFDPSGGVRGYVVRQPWSTCKHRKPRPGLPKAMSFLHKDEPLQSWYGCGQRVVVVEDQLSAICVEEHARDPEYGYRHSVCGVALLGTTLDMRKVREIQQRRPREVIIALDPDATDAAFKMAREWGLAFEKCRVAMLEQDIKDTPHDDIAEVLGL